MLVIQSYDKPLRIEQANVVNIAPPFASCARLTR